MNDFRLIHGDCLDERIEMEHSGLYRVCDRCFDDDLDEYTISCFLYRHCAICGELTTPTEQHVVPEETVNELIKRQPYG